MTGIRTRPLTPEYSEGYDRIFRKSKEQPEINVPYTIEQLKKQQNENYKNSKDRQRQDRSNDGADDGASAISS